MSESTILRIKTPTESYVLSDYPAAVEMAQKQNHVFWLHDEIKVEKDKQDLLVNMTPTEKHGVITTLKLFTKYELLVGTEYWGDIIAKRYPRPEIQRMANAFAFFELNVHAPFYNKINEELGLNTEHFYTSYVDDPVLFDRITFIDSILSHEDELLALAGFSLIEGAVLYSSFAYLKHFQSQGKNKLMNVVRGINFSVRDENIHAEAGAWLYKTILAEKLAAGEDINLLQLEDKIREVAFKIYEHECRIIDMIFEKGPVEGITAHQMKEFVKSRINECLKRIGIDKIFVVKYNPIAEWFYKGINDFQFNDFFSGVGNQYNRNWEKAGFVWKGRSL